MREQAGGARERAHAGPWRRGATTQHRAASAQHARTCERASSGVQNLVFQRGVHPGDVKVLQGGGGVGFETQPCERVSRRQLLSRSRRAPSANPHRSTTLTMESSCRYLASSTARGAQTVLLTALGGSKAGAAPQAQGGAAGKRRGGGRARAVCAQRTPPTPPPPPPPPTHHEAGGPSRR